MVFHRKGELTKKEKRQELIVEDGINNDIGWDLVTVVENWKYLENGIATLLCKISWVRLVEK